MSSRCLRRPRDALLRYLRDWHLLLMLDKLRARSAGAPRAAAEARLEALAAAVPRSAAIRVQAREVADDGVVTKSIWFWVPTRRAPGARSGLDA